jgi:hypothetical protein
VKELQARLPQLLRMTLEATRCLGPSLAADDVAALSSTGFLVLPRPGQRLVTRCGHRVRCRLTPSSALARPRTQPGRHQLHRKRGSSTARIASSRGRTDHYSVGAAGICAWGSADSLRRKGGVACVSASVVLWAVFEHHQASSEGVCCHVFC